MDSRRTKTLEVLSSFVQDQENLLRHTEADIELLKELRGRAEAQPEDFHANLSQELNHSSLKLSEAHSGASDILDRIDWPSLDHADPATMLALSNKRRVGQNAAPSQSQSSQINSLSPLQRLVKDARITILDPVFATLSIDPLRPPTPPSEEAVDRAVIQREKERAKTRELQESRHSRLTVGSSSRTPGFLVRRDSVDEDGQVDISMDADGSLLHAQSPVGNGYDAAADAAPSPSEPTPAKGSRSSARKTKRGPAKSRMDAPKRRKTKAEPTYEPPLPVSLEEAGRAKPATHNQTWTVSEQNLLERLLEEIPEGTRNRWQQISIAMNGRRTPRQVASRVQKYFEKLKRFGVGSSAAAEAV